MERQEAEGARYMQQEIRTNKRCGFKYQFTYYIEIISYGRGWGHSKSRTSQEGSHTCGSKGETF